MELSLTQASEASGRSKSTIHRAIKSGKISATRNEDGSYSISPSELFRVYPKEPPKAVPMTQHATPVEPKDDTEAVLRIKVEMLTAQLEREQETVEDLRKRLDKAEDRILALSAPDISRPKGLIARLLGR